MLACEHVDGSSEAVDLASYLQKRSLKKYTRIFQTFSPEFLLLNLPFLLTENDGEKKLLFLISSLTEKLIQEFCLKNANLTLHITELNRGVTSSSVNR